MRSATADRTRHSVYDEIDAFGGTIVTFNYTDFFGPKLRDRVLHFHGRLDEYLRMDTRDVVRDAKITGAKTVNEIVAVFRATTPGCRRGTCARSSGDCA